MNYNFNIHVAKEYGVNEAIMINNMVFWIARNKANGKNLFDGHTWTFNSVRAYNELFPFWSAKQIRRILDNLVKKGVLIKGNYNKMAYDRTSWYAFKNEAKFVYLDEPICPNGQIEEPKGSNRSTEKGEPIPDKNTDKNTDKNKGDIDIDFPNNLNNDKFHDMWVIWMQYRIEIKKKLTKSSIKAQLNKLSKCPNEAIEMLQQSITNGWTGIFPLKNYPPKQQNDNNQQVSPDIAEQMNAWK